MLQKAILATMLTLGLTAAAYQGDCQGKAKDCKSPVGNAHYYPEQRCTCFTCESGTTREKIICTRDENETQTLAARMRDDEKGEKDKSAIHKEEKDAPNAPNTSDHKKRSEPPH